MPNAVRSVRAALACSEGEIPGTCLRPLTGVVPTGTAPFAVSGLGTISGLEDIRGAGDTQDPGDVREVA